MSSQVEDIQMALTRYSSLDTGHSEMEVQVWKQFQYASPFGLVARLLEIKIYCQWSHQQPEQSTAQTQNLNQLNVEAQ
jgi:hypothetical protein